MTELTLRPMLEVEHKYAARQSQQLKMQCSAIGYLRGDFGKHGEEFHTTWFDEVASYKTPEFSAQFDDVVNALREQGGLLHHRSAMLSVCARNYPASKLPGEPSRQQYGFRVVCGEYAYLIKCNPHASGSLSAKTMADISQARPLVSLKAPPELSLPRQPDNYNFWAFAYQAKWLDRNIEHAAEGIRFIDSGYKTLFYVQDGDSIAVTRDGVTRQYACRYVDETHLEAGGELFHICQFAEKMERSGSSYEPVSPFVKELPMVCYAVRSISEGQGELLQVRNGYNGAIPYMGFGNVKSDIQAQADRLNKENGVTKAQAAAMLHGCLYGWHNPGTDPAHYDENGKFKQKAPREAER